MLGSPDNDDTAELIRKLEILDNLDLNNASQLDLRHALVLVGIEGTPKRGDRMKQRRYYVRAVKEAIQRWAVQVDTWLFCNKCIKWKIVSWDVARDLKVKQSILNKSFISI